MAPGTKRLIQNPQKPAKRLKASHPFGVQPLGNSFLDSTADSSRTGGLGCLARFNDEQLVQLIRWLPPTTCAGLVRVSAMFHAIACSEEIWREHCIDQQYKDCGALPWPGTWRAAYVARINATKGTELILPSPRATKARIYSDVLYHAFFCASIELERSWVEAETIARVDATSLSIEAFVDCFERKSVPVVLEGCNKHWPAMNWTGESLVVRFGDIPFTCGPCDLTLRDFYNYANSNLDEAPLFVFDRLFPRRAAGLLEDYEVPKFFQRDLFALLDCEVRPDFRWLIIGNKRSGSKWHWDPNKTSAWNAVVRGRKKWICLPPGCPPPGVTPSADGAEVTQPLSLIEWFMNFYAETKEMSRRNPNWNMIEGVCGPGDCVFVPTGWWHCVMNLDDDTIALTQNFVSDVNVHSVRRFLREKKDQVSGTRRKEALADLLDEKLREHRPDLLAAVDVAPTSSVVAGLNGESSTATKANADEEGSSSAGFSFWNHLRSTGKKLSFDKGGNIS